MIRVTEREYRDAIQEHEIGRKYKEKAYRMVAYSKDVNFVLFAKAIFQKTNIGISTKCTHKQYWVLRSHLKEDNER